MTLSTKTRTNNIPFSEIFQRKESLVVLFSNNMAANYRIVAKTLLWCSEEQDRNSSDRKTSFESVHYLFPDFQKDFFAHLLTGHNVKVSGINLKPSITPSGIVINLNTDKNILKGWAGKSNTVIMGTGKQINVKFLPPSTDPDTIINKASELLNLPSPQETLELSKTPYNPNKIKASGLTGKTVAAVNSFWKRQSVIRKEKAEFRDFDNVRTIVCRTRKKWFFSQDLTMNLKEIVAECYGANRIITDDRELQFVLERLGFKGSGE